MNSFHSEVSPSISIVSLSEQPQWLQQIVEWHQGEWPHQNLQQRAQKLKQHLSTEPVPTTLLAMEGDGANLQLLGTASLVRYQRLGGLSTSYWLANMFVIPERRQQGVGSQLMHAIEKHAQKNGIDELYLYATDRVRFYQQRGWTAVREKIVRGQSATIMSCQLVS